MVTEALLSVDNQKCKQRDLTLFSPVDIVEVRSYFHQFGRLVIKGYLEFFSDFPLWSFHRSRWPTMD